MTLGWALLLCRLPRLLFQLQFYCAWPTSNAQDVAREFHMLLSRRRTVSDWFS